MHVEIAAARQPAAAGARHYRGRGRTAGLERRALARLADLSGIPYQRLTELHTRGQLPAEVLETATGLETAATRRALERRGVEHAAAHR